LQDHDAFNAHENEISGRQNHVTVMPDPCEPHHGTAAADPPIAPVAQSVFRVSSVSEGALLCLERLGLYGFGGFRCGRRNK
jgi:hypothetical protein